MAGHIALDILAGLGVVLVVGVVAFGLFALMMSNLKPGDFP